MTGSRTPSEDATGTGPSPQPIPYLKGRATTFHAPAHTTVELASPGRRLGGAILEGLPLALIFVVGIALILTGSGAAAAIGILVILGGAIGYIAWVFIAASNGQTPGKKMTNMFIVRKDGTVAGLGDVLLRDWVIKGLLFGIISNLTFGIVWLISALWCTWDQNRQCLWDKLTNTRVVHAPGGRIPSGKPVIEALEGQGAAELLRGVGPRENGAAENLRTLAELHERGLLTDEEYEERRTREVARL